MFEEFIKWARKTNFEFVVEKVVTIVHADAGSSARVDMDTKTAFARVTCWDSNDFYSEIIGSDTEEQIHSGHGEFTADTTIEKQLEEFIGKLKNTG